MRTILIWVAAAAVFGSFFAMIGEKESLLRNGQTVYLKLAPVDPRSLLQGDYMSLNYDVSNQLMRDQGSPTPPAVFDSGVIVIKLDPNNVGAFSRYGPATNLAPGEHALIYHHSDSRFTLGAESFFIPEGTGANFDQAKFGELKLEPDGTALIVALCDKDLHRLVAARPSP
jgi:uncharacterized membrane-anchored protein